jgi:repressor LexA
MTMEGAGMSYSRKRELTDRQRQIFEFIKAENRRKGYPPTVRDIGQAVGLSSSSTVHSHLTALEAKGLIKRDPSKPRALEVIGHDREDRTPEIRGVVQLPVLGAVAAGSPMLAEENIESTIPLPIDVVREDSTFVLRVKGDSMIDAGILDRDYVVVRQQQTAENGDIVVALLDDEATVKRFFREPDRVRLQPENATMEPIYARDITVLGKVVAVFRRM